MEFTREQLRERARGKVKKLEYAITQSAFTAIREGIEEELELARIALASLEAEPVGCDACGGNGSVDIDHGEMGIEHIECPKCYTAPPAPVSVPDLKELEEILDWILMLPCPTPKATHFAKRLAVVIDTCRAAMLQGADGNSPVIPDGWVACSERLPEGMQTVITSNGFDIGQGWWDGEGWNSFNSHDVVPGAVSHWMPLPAAPH